MGCKCLCCDYCTANEFVVCGFVFTNVASECDQMMYEDKMDDPDT